MKEYTPAPPEVGRPNPSAPAPTAPPPRSTPPSKGLWVWLLLLAAAIGAAYYFWPKVSVVFGGNSAGAPAATKSGGGAGGKGGRGMGVIPVVAVKAMRGSIGEYVTGMGNVTPIYTVTVKTRVDGQLMEVRYKEGDLVQKDTPLVEVDPRPYQVQLEQAEGALVRDQALLDNAKVDLDRYEGLLKQNAIPEQQYATQKALVKQDEGVVKADQGQIDSARLNLVYCHITAPISGRIGLRLVDPGNIVHATDTNGLLVITQVQPISVIFPIAEDQIPKFLPRFRSGQSLRVDAWDRDQTHKLGTGTLVTVDNQIDPTTGTVRLRADFPNTNDALFPNQLAYARLLVQEKTGVTLVPTDAIQRSTATETGTYVYLVKPDSTVTVRNITVGTSEGDESQVLSGLAPGDVVVMTGVDKLNEGSKVNVQLQGSTQRTAPAGGGSPGGSSNTGAGPPAGSGGTPVGQGGKKH
ncbi:MAG TPA: efflux RND transporter periplasmic adaptor subunit [Bryobacteraceae bacterium]|nr:efflux RND transporter periplasmic adaptor subunit [Bryobacteraceae bacterium]